MSSILDALRKAKKLAGGSAPQKAPAYLKSFGFAEQAKGNKTKKILVTYVVPVVVLGAIIASGVLYWINRTASSPMAEQAQLLEVDPALGTEPLFPEDDGLLPPEDGPEEGEQEASLEGGEAETGEVVEGDPVAAGEPGPSQASGPQEPGPPTMEQAETSVAVPPPGPPPQTEPPVATEPDEPIAQDLDPEGAGDTGAATPGQDEIALQATLTGDDPAPSPNPPVVGELRVEAAASDPFELAVFYHQAGDYVTALPYYIQVLDADPRNASARNNLGLLYMAMGNIADAIKEFRFAIQINANYDLAHNNLGTALMEAGQESEAVREYDRAIAINPRNAEVITNLANYYKQEGETERAKILYLEALQANPSSAQAHYGLGSLYEVEGEVREAIDHFKRFLELGSSQYPQLVESVEQKIRELSSGG